MARHRTWHSARIRQRGQSLRTIERQLHQIAAHLARAGTPTDVQQAIEDVFNTYGQVSQIREVLQQLVLVVREHDANSTREREEIRGLLVQLRELARKQVRSHEDLARAIGAGDGAWDGQERRTSIPDRRRA